MPKKSPTVRVTADDARRMLASDGDRSDWRWANAMTQAEVERLADEEDGPLPENWESTVILGVPEPKQDVHIRLDPGVLRAFVQARQREERNLE